MIPKVINYCWFGKKEKDEKIIKCIDSWKDKCPEYKIIEWNEENFNININEYTQRAYKEGKMAFVSDFARLWIIYNYGGIYLDVDVEIIKNIDDLLEYESFFGFEDNQYINTGLGFGAVKNNEIINKMMSEYNNLNFTKEDGTLDLTACPIRNSKSIDYILKTIKDKNEKFIYKNNLFLPQEYLCPFKYNTGELLITEKTYSIHWCNSSWLDEYERKLMEDKKKLVGKYGKKIGRILYFIKKFFILLIKNPKEIIKKIFKRK